MREKGEVSVGGTFSAGPNFLTRLTPRSPGRRQKPSERNSGVIVTEFLVEEGRILRHL